MNMNMNVNLIFPEKHVVVHLVEALHCKAERRGLDSWWFHWNFSFSRSCCLYYSPGVSSASNKNWYQKYLLGVEAASV